MTAHKASTFLRPGVKLGEITRLAPSLGSDITIDGQKFLQSGLATTDAHPSLPKNIPGPIEFKLLPNSNVAASNIQCCATNGAGIVILFSNAASNQSLRSTDYGETWETLSVAGVNVALAAAKEANGTWIVVGSSASGQIYRSTNGGASWSLVHTPGTGRGSVATNGAGVWMAGAQSTGDISISLDDGVTWTTGSISGGPFGSSDGVNVETDGAGTWIAAGGATSSSSSKIAISTNNGASWTSADYAGTSNNAFTSVATDGEGNWLAIGSNSSLSKIAAISHDNGATWIPSDIASGESPYSTAFNSLIYAGAGLWLATNQFSVIYSNNLGKNWSTLTQGVTMAYRGACSDADRIYFAAFPGLAADELAAISQKAFGINIDANDAETYYVRYF